MLAVLSLLMGFAPISIDLYLPALPAMGGALRAGPGTVEWTVSGYLLGFSFGQLLWGPLSDRYGRRGPVVLGLVLFVVGSVGCALAGGIGAVIFWRVVQAVGGSAGVVLSRAMVRDLYEGHRAAQMLSLLLTVMGVAPMLGPILGAQILFLGGWRAIFWTLVAVGLATIAAMCTLPETLPPARRHGGSPGQALRVYGALLRHRRLLAYAGTAGCFYVGFFAYIAGTPFAYIIYHHVPPQYFGLLFGLVVLGIMATNLLNVRLVARHGADRLLGFGARVAAAASLVTALDAWTGWGGVGGLVAPLFFFIAPMGFIVANAIAGALADFPTRAGAVSAFVGAVQYGSGILGSGLIGVFADGTPWPMGWVIALGGLGSLACARLLRAP